MPENPYKSPEDELPVRRPKLLRMVVRGALWGLATGVAVTIPAIFLVEDQLGPSDIYWQDFLAACLACNFLLTVLGSTVAFVIGLIRS